MKSRIWRMAGVGLLCVSVSAQVLAEERDERRPPQQGAPSGGQREHAPEGRGENNQGHPANVPNRPQPAEQPPRPQNDVIRGENSRQFEHNGQNPGGQWQNHPQHDANQAVRPAPQPAPQQQQQQPRPAPSLPIQGRPDTVRQTQEPQRGYYQDIPRRNDYNQHWQAGGPGSRPDNGRPNDYRWPGRPDGHGNGWGPGPQYRPGYVIDRFPGRNDRVAYRGQDYFFSGGYWYRPQGPRYVVVHPPYGIRVTYLPDYAREIWMGGTLLFLAAGAYYTYEADTQQYVVVEPPQGMPLEDQQPAGNGYDVLAYPISGQSPQQIDQDRYDCYRWAVQQSGFDPASVTYQPAPQVVQAYRQAQGNCLSSRGYEVTY